MHRRFSVWIPVLVVLGAAVGGHLFIRSSSADTEAEPGGAETQEAGAAPDGPAQADRPWWRGNLHTHTLWSDGDDYPEMVVDWYKEHGYHFLVLSDHNMLSQGMKWINPATDGHAVRGGGLETFRHYVDRFGEGWVETRDAEGQLEVRLKPLDEFRRLFEEPGRFMLMQGEEITEVVHVNATNIIEYIPPQGGETVVETMRNNVEAVYEQRARTGQPMFPHINHPNFQWAITAEELARVERARFCEVFNGHRGVHNYGDEQHAGLDRMWDIVLTLRLTELGLGAVYGLAVDDTHNYREAAPNTARPGRGWVMVQAAHLTPEHIIEGLETGHFYATTGVTLRAVTYDETGYAVEIDPEPGVRYVTQFIGTRSGFDASSEPVTAESGEGLHVTRRYSHEVGEVLAEVAGSSPSYTWQGDEVYVRAKVISDKLHPDPFQEGDTEVAWTQPVVLREGRPVP